MPIKSLEQTADWHNPYMSGKIITDVILQTTLAQNKAIEDDHTKREEYLNVLYPSHTQSDTIYHYTSIESFFHIISDQTFLATDALYLNDKEEHGYQIKVFEKVLNNLFETSSKPVIEKQIFELDIPSTHRRLNIDEVPDRLPLKEIILGPCVDRHFVKPGIRSFLDSKGYYNVIINQSNIPIRNM